MTMLLESKSHPIVPQNPNVFIKWLKPFVQLLPLAVEAVVNSAVSSRSSQSLEMLALGFVLCHTPFCDTQARLGKSHINF